MLKSLILGAILGGLTAFLWSFISWDLLPWHEKQLRSFQSEDEVSAVIASHAPESGNYLLPTGPPQEGMSPDQKKAAQEIRMRKMQKGPLVFVAVRREGFGSFPRVLLTQLLCQLFAALLLTWTLLQTSGLSCAPRRVSRHRRTRRQRHRRSSQLELVGLLRHVYLRKHLRPCSLTKKEANP